MKTISGSGVFLAVLTFIVCSATTLTAQVTSPEQKEIWSLEECYWKDVQALDLNDFLKLWNDDFKGWPATSNSPIPKDSAANVIRDPLASGSKMTQYKLHPKVVQIFGRTAIAIYAVTFTWVAKDGKVERTGQWYKLIHTWQKDGNEWKIIGSLSAPLPTPDPS